jgi:hypothetical protein
MDRKTPAPEEAAKRAAAREALPEPARDPKARWCEKHDTPWVNQGYFSVCPYCYYAPLPNCEQARKLRGEYRAKPN